MSGERHIILPSVTIVTGVNDGFSIDEGAGDLACTIASGTYFLRGDATSDDLLEAVTVAMNAAGADTYSSDLLISSTGAITCTLTNETATNKLTWGTFDGLDLGIAAANFTDSFASVQAPRGFWVPDDVAEVVDEVPRAIGSQIGTVGGQTYTHDRSGQAWIDVSIVWPWLQEDHVEFLGLASTAQPRTLYRCWERWRDGRSVEIHEKTISTTSLVASAAKGTFVLDGGHINGIRATRQAPGIPFYTCEPILWRAWVAQ